jgi:hypothetical protein
LIGAAAIASSLRPERHGRRSSEAGMRREGMEEGEDGGRWRAERGDAGGNGDGERGSDGGAAGEAGSGTARGIERGEERVDGARAGSGCEAGWSHVSAVYAKAGWSYVEVGRSHVEDG